jgi:hypothetical protein
MHCAHRPHRHTGPRAASHTLHHVEDMLTLADERVATVSESKLDSAEGIATGIYRVLEVFKRADLARIGARA